MTTQLERHLFTVNDYHVMIDAGILTEDHRVELVRGEIIAMAPIGDLHASCVDRLVDLLIEQLRRRALIRVQSPVRVDEYTEFQPDVMLLERHDDYYSSGPPRPEHVFLMMEVSNTSTQYDRNVKVPIYARAGIQEVWLIDIQAGLLEVFSQPSQEGYASIQTLGSGDSVSPSAFPDIALIVDDIIP